jgi:hypothetical protein
VPEIVDGVCFLLGTVQVLWLGVLLVSRDLALEWWSVLYLIAFWLVTAYVGLPRLQEILAKIYVPDYFIGRTVTSSGILGDPVNLGLNGSTAQIHATMTQAGWTRADELTVKSSVAIVKSAVLRRSYPSAPVSHLLLFGRPESFAYEQQVGGNASHRHHLRFWPTPEGWLLPGGRRVGWLAAGTFDRAVGLSLFTLQVTHKVDADIDLERDHVVATVTGTVPTAQSQVLENFVAAFHARNGGGDVVRTDGNLVILDLTSVAASSGTLPPPVQSPRLPPPALLTAGALSIGEALFHAASLSLLVVPSTIGVALWIGTLGRRAWARTLLMLVCAVQAAVQLGTVSAKSGHLGLEPLLDAGVAVLVLIVVSSDQARHWVSLQRNEHSTAGPGDTGRPPEP